MTSRVYVVKKPFLRHPLGMDEPFTGPDATQLVADGVERVSWTVPASESWEIVEVDVWRPELSRVERMVSLSVAAPRTELGRMERALEQRPRHFTWLYVCLRAKNNRVVVRRSPDLPPLALSPSSRFLVRSDRLPVSVRVSLARSEW